MQTGVAVTIHGTIDSAASAPNSATVASVATTSNDLVDPVKILQPVATTTWALAAAFDRFVRWTRSSMEWQFKDTLHLGVPHAGLHPILEEMVALGAFPCNDQSLGMTATPEQGLLLQPLEVAGLVKDKDFRDENGDKAGCADKAGWMLSFIRAAEKVNLSRMRTCMTCRAFARGRT